MNLPKKNKIASIEQAVKNTVAGIKEEKKTLYEVYQRKNKLFQDVVRFRKKTENYNRSDNIRIIGLLMNETRENYGETIDEVIGVSEKKEPMSQFKIF